MAKRRGVFISYRRADSAGHAGRLFDTLRSRLGEAHAFLDVDSIAPGVDFRSRIEGSIQNSAVVIAVIGPGWMRQGKDEVPAGPSSNVDHVHVELNAARTFGVPVLPVLVGGARMPEAADLPEGLRYVTSLNAIVLNDTMWLRDADVLARTLHLNHGVGNTRLAHVRDVALFLALSSAGLLLVSLELGASSAQPTLHGMIRFVSLATLLGYLVAIGWLARDVGGSRFVGLSGLAALGVYFRALDAEGLALFVVVASVLLFKDISALDEKASRRLVDLFDYLLEGAVLGAGLASVLSPIVFLTGGAAFDSLRHSALFKLLADPRDVFPGLGTGLVVGTVAGLAWGFRRFRRRERNVPFERAGDALQNVRG